MVCARATAGLRKPGTSSKRIYTKKWPPPDAFFCKEILHEEMTYISPQEKFTNQMPPPGEFLQRDCLH